MTRHRALLLGLVVVTALSIALCGCGLLIDAPSKASVPNDAAESSIAFAFREKRSDVLVSGEGVVTRILADDDDGDRHQRFILKLDSGQTLHMAHNIDIAPRVESLAVGDSVAFAGVYEYNTEGGVVHWTHHDPAGEHAGGWLEHEGQTYQ